MILNNKHKNMLLEAGSNANIECKLKLYSQRFLISNPRNMRWKDQALYKKLNIKYTDVLKWMEKLKI